MVLLISKLISGNSMRMSCLNLNTLAELFSSKSAVIMSLIFGEMCILSMTEQGMQLLLTRNSKAGGTGVVNSMSSSVLFHHGSLQYVVSLSFIYVRKYVKMKDR